MKHTSHSEYLPISSVFIKTAKAAFISEQKLNNEWEALNYISRPNFKASRIEYQNFESLLKKEGAAVRYFQEDGNLSIDSIYCRDASIATDHGMILCHMGKAARTGEPKAQKDDFLAHGIPILGTIKAPATLEGGDVAWVDPNTLAVGHSYRTNEEGIYQLEQLLTPYGISILVVDLPHYKGTTDVFHLMSIFSPVDKDMAVVYSPLMPISFRKELKKRDFAFVEVPDAEFESMGCNVLAIAPRKCLMVAGNPMTENALKKAGCEVLTYPGLEISVKGGGGPTCLTRPVMRRL